MWILPSRNRPDRVARMFDKAPPSTRGIVAVDADQAKLYRGVKLPAGWVVEASQRCQYVAKHNFVFQRYPNEEWYGSLSDDMVPITEGWDVKLIERAGVLGVAYADDLFTRRSGAFAVGGDLVRKLGWIFPPCFVHYYGDTTMELLCRELGLAGMQRDVIVEHRHYANKTKPGKYDETSLARPKLQDERKIWNEWLACEWPGIRQRLQDA